MALPHYLTVDGYEIQFATNHLGHFLLTKLLLPMLQSTADRSPVGSVRVVNVASIGHNAAWNGLDFSDLPKQLEMSWSRLIPYGMSKLANILHARSLAKRYPDVLSVSAHPGLIMSGLHSTWLGDSSVMKMGFEVMKTMTSDLAQGAYNQLYIATMPQVLLDRDNGEYFVQVGTKATDSWYPYRPSRFAKDDKLADRLWDWSENELKKHGYV
jgi:NAD(P)-dependent dehydrogenase (short-subunit alcohol dehydrogenase family)